MQPRDRCFDKFEGALKINLRLLCNGKAKRVDVLNLFVTPKSAYAQPSFSQKKMEQVD